jgi:hypothetical protein
MEIRGVDGGDVNHVVWDDGAERLTGQALAELVERLARTTTCEEVLFREVELDCAFRLAESDLIDARRDGLSAARIELLEETLTHVVAAHDLVGVSRMTEAITALKQAIELTFRAEAAGTGSQ